MEATQAFAAHLDAEDPLKGFRKEFLIPQRSGKEQLYLLGNSLGLQPRRTAEMLQQVLEQWHDYGVEGFFTGSQPWLEYHDQLVQPLSRIVGAMPHEVVVMNSLTVNLHLLLVSFYQPKGERKKILCEAKAFPSDQYLLETHVRQRGLDPDQVIIEVAPREGETNIRNEDILTAIDQHGQELALVFWGGVNYYTGQVFDMPAITQWAHAAGAKVGFDLAHAAGNIALHLHEWEVDFAAWCSYKYLNSGPGAVGGCFINERYHLDKDVQRFAGWWGYQKETRFLMQKGFVPISTAEGWQLSTPSPLLYAAHKAALELFAAAGIAAVLNKGKSLSDFLLFLVNDINKTATNKMQVLTPVNAKGCQLSLLVPQVGKHVFSQLTEAGVFADWREPDVIRVAPVPLYNSFTDVWLFSQILKAALA